MLLLFAVKFLKMIEQWFQLSKKGSTVRAEVLAGVTTWITMVYIAAVNPAILAEAGMDFGAVFVATCLATAISSAIMGLISNHPVALAPGMTLNAFFAYTIVIGGGYSWNQALGAVFWSGIIFVILSISPVRKTIIRDMPECLKMGATVGIGLFLAVLGLQNSGIVEPGDGTLITLGDVRSVPFLLSILGLVVIFALQSRGKPWAVISGVLLVTCLGWLLDDNAKLPEQAISMPPSLAPTFLQLQWKPVIDFGFLALVISLLFVDFFDTTGTLIAVAKQGGFMDDNGQVKNLDRCLIADSTSTVAGALLGTSTTTAYIESNTGISAGGKTGLTAIVVSIMFLLTLFFSPLAASIPSYATGPALICVSILLVRSMKDFKGWTDVTEAASLTLTAILIPLSFSIVDGLAAGCIIYTLINLFSGKFRQLNWVTLGMTLAFVLRFAFLYQE